LDQQLFSINEFCAIVNLGRTTTYKLLNAGILKAVKTGRTTMIPAAAVHEFIATLTPYQPTNIGKV